MADEQQVPAAPESEAGTMAEMIASAVAEAEGRLEEKYKANVNGLNRRVSEVEKERDSFKATAEDAKKAAMDEQERAEYERQKYQENLQERERAIDTARWELMVNSGLSDAKLDSSIRTLMEKPETEEGLNTWIETLQNYVKSQTDARVNLALVNNSGPKAEVGDEVTAPLTQEEADKFDWDFWNSKPKPERDAAWNRHLERLSVG